MPVILAIVGSRTVAPSIGEIDLVVDGLPLSWDFEGQGPEAYARIISAVVDGGADGGDYAGKLWADARGIPVLDEPVTDDDYKRWGRYKAPKVRNGRVADRADIGIAFWNGHSSGTTDFIARMVLRRKLVVCVPTRDAEVKLKRPKVQR